MTHNLEDILEAHNIEPNRMGYINCLVHEDEHPSAKVNDDYVYCFTCGWSADAAGVEALLSGRHVNDVLAAWSRGGPAWQTPKHTLTAVPKWRQCKDLFVEYVVQSQELIRDVLHNLPSWYHQVAKERLWDILDEIEIEWKDSAPYALGKTTKEALAEVQAWATFWRAAGI